MSNPKDFVARLRHVIDRAGGAAAVARDVNVTPGDPRSHCSDPQAVKLLALTLLALCTAVAKPVKIGRCTGADPCPVCTDCSACKWCDPKNPKGGSCGVCRDQSGDEARRREKRRAPGAAPGRIIPQRVKRIP